jgi:serine protease AprX
VNLLKPRQIGWFGAVVAMVSVAIAISLGPQSHSRAASGSSSKVSPDLAALIRSDRGGSRANLIVQFGGESQAIEDSLLLSLGAKVKQRLNKLNSRVVELPLPAVEALARHDEVRYISTDRPLGTLGHLSSTTGTDAVRTQTTTSLDGLITTTTVFDGTGVGIAIIDSGIDSNHVEFRNQIGLSRVIASRDFTGENQTKDLYGHGTHVASIAAGNGEVSNGAYLGIAPNANLINLRILDSHGLGSTSNLLAALDWVMTYRSVYNIRVINMSVGTPAIDSYLNDPVCQAVRRVTDAGIVVVAAAGNSGKTSSGQKVYGQIHSPGNEPSAITVGAANSFGTDARIDDAVTTYSSRGPTRSYWIDANGLKHNDNLLKPDLIAPGNKVIAAAAQNNYLLNLHPELNANVSTASDRQMMYLSGSSMAAPIAAGTAALLLQATPTLTPSLVKAILMYTAQPLPNWNILEQGAGEINVEGALRLAKLVRPNLTSFTQLGEPLLTSSAPAQATNLNGETFSWSRGIILNHTYATGPNLVTKYQTVYANGSLLGDAVIENSSSQSIITSRMSDGILLGTNIVISDGTSLGNGSSFLDIGWLIGDGAMVGDGMVLGDGVMVGDGIMVADGVMVGDGTLESQSALAGDNTPCMR